MFAGAEIETTGHAVIVTSGHKGMRTLPLRSCLRPKKRPRNRNRREMLRMEHHLTWKAMRQRSALPSVSPKYLPELSLSLTQRSVRSVTRLSDSAHIGTSPFHSASVAAKFSNWAGTPGWLARPHPYLTTLGYDLVLRSLHVFMPNFCQIANYLKAISLPTF